MSVDWLEKCGTNIKEVQFGDLVIRRRMNEDHISKEIYERVSSKKEKTKIVVFHGVNETFKKREVKHLQNKKQWTDIEETKMVCKGRKVGKRYNKQSCFELNLVRFPFLSWI